MSGRLRIGVLGPFEVARNGKSVEIPPGKVRALLTLLLLDRGRVVPVDRLVEQLWDGRPPPSASKQVQVYVARLRKLLGDGLLVTSSPGYALRIEDEQLDAACFESLVENARGEQATAAAKRLREALALWRGPPLVDFSYDAWAQEEIRRLEELHLEALEARIEADLALGRHEQAVAELESLAHAHPLRERLQALLMVALYRCGRQAEALEAYRSARHRLIEELGLEPSPELQQLERAILEHDPTLAAPARVARHDKRRAPNMPALRGGRSRLLVIAGVIVLAAVAAGTGVRLSEGSRRLHASPNSVAVIDADHDSVRRVIEGAGRLGGIASGPHAVWATDTAHGFLLRIDPSSGTIKDRIPVGQEPTGVAVGDGQVWVVSQLDRTVSEVNPRAGKEVNRIEVGNGADAIAFGDGWVWVANDTDGTLSRIDPAGTTRTKTIPLDGTPAGIAVGPQGVWVTIPSSGELLLIDPKIDQVVQRTPIGNGPNGVAVGSGAVWVANTPDDTVTRVDPGSPKLTKINVGDAPAGVAYGNGAVWVANSRSGTVSRIDPTTGSKRDVELTNEPTTLAFAGGDIWTTVLPSPASHQGGTLRVVSYPAVKSLANMDPAQLTAYSQVQTLSLTNDGLVTYRRVDGLAGAELVPDLATRLPSPTNGGRTYTFQLRRGIHYSNGELVRPEDFRRELERVFRLGPNWYGSGSVYLGIRGGKRCAQKPRECNLSRGIVANDIADTVTFHLARPDGDFLYRLAFTAADAVPKEAPLHSNIGSKPLPATGPYMVRSFSPGRRLVLMRNRHFHVWSADAQPKGFPDRIVLTQGSAEQEAREVTSVEHGSADVMFWPPLGNLAGLATRFTSQLHSDPLGWTSYLAMNTRVPPFDRPEVRRALNYAIDRNLIVKDMGGPLVARTTCQILAPTQPGYRPYCPYTLDPSAAGSWTAPNYARAEKLVKLSGTHGTKVTLFIGAPGPNAPTFKVGSYIVSVLDQLGYRASLKIGDPCALMSNPHARIQIGWCDTTVFLFATGSEFANYLSCSQFSSRSTNNLNADEFCSHGIDAQVRRASKLLTQNQTAGSAAWSRIDRELVQAAPWAPLYNGRQVALVSARVGNYEYHPYFNVLLDQLWVR
jgi:DNA-binding SARP family transcriptional activator/ABC-type transport system substrate-binding protein/streptogramin lyase